MKNRLLVLGALGLLAASLSGCNDYYGPAWYNVYGGYCGSGQPSPGCNYFSDGYKIVAGEDPYYSSSTLSFGTWNYYDTYGNPASFYGWAWQSPTGIIYNQYGTALNETGDSEGRDLIANAADLERKTIEGAGKKFAKDYALNEATGIRIAETLNSWATLGKSRSRSEQDVADYSKRLYGIGVDQAKSAIDRARKGDQQGLEDAAEDISQSWDTKASNVRRILKDWYKDQLSEVNVK